MTTGEEFLQVDSHYDGSMLMFGSAESIAFLRNSPDWFMDVTFDTVPHTVSTAVYSTRIRLREERCWNLCSNTEQNRGNISKNNGSRKVSHWW